MAEESRIEWTRHTFNPWSGCAKVSPGCAFCYADASPPSWRRGAEWGVGKPRVLASEGYWKAPLAWNRRALEEGQRHRVFCASMADVMEDRDDLDPWRERLWALIRETPGLDWLLLTKRPEKMARWVAAHGLPVNAWVGTSVENQDAADARIDHLLAVAAGQKGVVRFLSMEPLLGPVDLSFWVERLDHCRACGAENPAQVEDLCPECGRVGTLISTWGQKQAEDLRSGARYENNGPGVDDDGPRISWVIVGGESGPHARPMHPGWALALRDQCVAAGTPFFFKQHGEWVNDQGKGWARGLPGKIALPGGDLGDSVGDLLKTDCAILSRVGKKEAGRVLDGRTWDEFPKGRA